VRAADLKVGTRCFTYVSGDRVEVEITQDTGERGRRYLVKRVDNGKPLGKRRSAAALHASSRGGAFGPAEARVTQPAPEPFSPEPFSETGWGDGQSGGL
jgi:hypothetical protein